MERREGLLDEDEEGSRGRERLILELRLRGTSLAKGWASERKKVRPLRTQKEAVRQALRADDLGSIVWLRQLTRRSVLPGKNWRPKSTSVKVLSVGQMTEVPGSKSMEMASFSSFQTVKVDMSESCGSLA